MLFAMFTTKSAPFTKLRRIAMLRSPNPMPVGPPRLVDRRISSAEKLCLKLKNDERSHRERKNTRIQSVVDTRENEDERCALHFLG